MVFQLIVMMGLYGAIYSPLEHVLRLSDSVIEVLSNAYNLIADTASSSANTAYRIQLNILSRFSDVVGALPSVENSSVVTDDIIAKIKNFIDHFTIFGIDLTQTPNTWSKEGAILLIIPILAGLTAFLSAGFTYLRQRKTNPEMAKNPTMGCMTFMSPVMSIVFAYTLPAGIGFYWIISNILSFIQLIALTLIYKPADIIAQQMIDETVYRRSREQSVKTTRALMKAREEQQNN